MEKPREGLISPSELRSTVGFQEAKKHDPDGKLLIILAFKTNFFAIAPRNFTHIETDARGRRTHVQALAHTHTLPFS